MKINKKKNLDFKIIAEGGSSKHGTFGGGKVEINKPIIQNLNVNVKQNISYAKPKNKGLSIKAGDTSFGFEKNSKKSKITGHLTGNIEDRKVISYGGSYKRNLNKGQSLTFSLEKNKGGGRVGLQYRKEFN